MVLAIIYQSHSRNEALHDDDGQVLNVKTDGLHLRHYYRTPLRFGVVKPSNKPSKLMPRPQLRKDLEQFLLAMATDGNDRSTARGLLIY